MLSRVGEDVHNGQSCITRDCAQVSATEMCHGHLFWVANEPHQEGRFFWPATRYAGRTRSIETRCLPNHFNPFDPACADHGGIHLWLHGRHTQQNSRRNCILYPLTNSFAVLARVHCNIPHDTHGLTLTSHYRHHAPEGQPQGEAR